MKTLFVIFIFLQFPSYSQVINISENTSTSKSPHIIANKNIIYIFWNDNNDGDYDIYYKYYFEGNWSEVNKINAPTSISLSSICIDDSNFIHLLWFVKDENKILYGRLLESTLIDSMEIYKSDTSEITFCSSLFDESTQQFHVSLDINSDDSIYTFYSFKDMNNNWSDKQVIVINNNFYGLHRAQIVKDKLNDIICLWFDADSMRINMIKKIDDSWIKGTSLTIEYGGIGLDYIAVNDDNLNIHIVSHPAEVPTCPCNGLLYSKWDGSHWSNPELVPSDAYAFYTEHNYPDIAFSTNYNPVITWQQNSYDAYLNPGAKYIGTSVKTDSDWHINRVFERSRKAENPNIIVDENDFINYVWQDTSDGDYDIYFYKTAIITSVESDNDFLFPDEILLNQNYPNPFNPSTQISFYLPISSSIDLSVYNIIGQKIKTLYNGFMSPGQKVIIWNGRNNEGAPVNSGIYIYILKSDALTLSRKMVLMR